MKKTTDRTLYASPFEKGYWRAALSEFKSLRMLVMAALFIALRIAVKLVSIDLGGSLKLGVDFLVNSVGSMVCGPLVGLLIGAVSDTLGFLIHPSGDYFLPFMLVEMSSSFIFGLFLYRAKLTKTRMILSRFAVIGFCNLILTQLFLKWQYTIMYAKDYAFFRWARVVKNLCLFPAEAFLLCFWLTAISAVTYKLGLTHAKPEKLKITAGTIILVILLALFAAGCVIAYPYVKDFLAANNIK